MADRLLWLFLAPLFAALAGCGSTTPSQEDKEETSMESARPVGSAAGGRDAVEVALARVAEGRVMRLDLNTPGQAMTIEAAHLLSRDVLLEMRGEQPKIYAVERETLTPQWTTRLEEPSAYPATETENAYLVVSDHFLHAMERHSGQPTFQIMGGELAGLRRMAPLRLPFAPTGSAAGQHDTAYLPSLGSPDTNKTLESFSLLTGQRGWGYRTAGDILVAPKVGGPAGDPRLYFVTRSGVVASMNAASYGYPPAGLRWEESLDAGVRHPFALTADSGVSAGALYLVDVEGTVYCLDRMTGRRRWVDATGRSAVGGPEVFGNVCVVKMNTGFIGYEKDGLLYGLRVVRGPDRGRQFWVRPGKTFIAGSGGGADVRLSDSKVSEQHAVFDVQNEVLYVAAAEGESIRVDDLGAQERAGLFHGSRVHLGDTVLEVTSVGAKPLWTDLRVERILGRIGDRLYTLTGNRVRLVDAYTGEFAGEPVEVPARMFLANHHDAKLFVVGGDAILYALYPR